MPDQTMNFQPLIAAESRNFLLLEPKQISRGAKHGCPLPSRRKTGLFILRDKKRIRPVNIMERRYGPYQCHIQRYYHIVARPGKNSGTMRFPGTGQTKFSRTAYHLEFPVIHFHRTGEHKHDLRGKVHIARRIMRTLFTIFIQQKWIYHLKGVEDLFEFGSFIMLSRSHGKKILTKPFYISFL